MNNLNISREGNEISEGEMLQAFRKIPHGEMLQAFRYVPDGETPRFLLEKERFTMNPIANAGWINPNLQITQGNNNQLSVKNDNKKINQYILAKQAIMRSNFVICNNLLYIFDGSGYVPVGPDPAMAEIKECLSEKERENCPMNTINSAFSQVRTQKGIYMRSWKKWTSLEFIPFKNGILNVFTRELRKTSPEDYVLAYNDHNWELNPYQTTRGDAIEQFLWECSCGDQVWVELAWTIIGAVLGPTSLFKKFFYIYGVPNSGKSIFCSLLEHIVGTKFSSFVALNTLDKRFALVDLIGKKLNICSDESSEPLRDISVFKKLTSGGADTITIDVKYGEPVQFHTDMIRFVIGSNHSPRLFHAEEMDAFLERMVILPFMRKVPPQFRDAGLLEKLKRDTDYIINKGALYYRLFLQNNMMFPQTKVGEQLMMQWNNNVDLLELFVSECCELEYEAKTTNDELYSAYRKFCIEYKKLPDNHNVFIENLRNKFFLKPTRISMGDSRPQGTIGIRLK